MNRLVIRARLMLGLLTLANAAWLYAAGSGVAFLANAIGGHDRRPAIVPCLASILLALYIGRAYMHSRLPAAARRAELRLSRVVGVVELAAAIAFLFGATHGMSVGLRLAPPSHLVVLTFVFGSVLVPFLAGYCSSQSGTPLLESVNSDGASGAPFFLRERGHLGSYDARKYLVAAAAFAGVFLAAAHLALRHTTPGEPAFPFLPSGLWRIGLGFVGGAALALIQNHWFRALGNVPKGWQVLTVGLVGWAFRPAGNWPLVVIGVAAGLSHAPLITGLLAAVPPRQRLAAMLIREATVTLSAILMTFAFIYVLREEAAVWGMALLALLGAIGFTYWFFREFVEQINELLFRPLWRPHGYGPGLHAMPTRGPLLIIANHAAWFDPVWLAALVPLRARALMSSQFLDKPFLKWLAGRVYRAIRVPDRGFRRTAPEIDQAVAALREGDAVMIFPEGWLRRKEEQPLRRFANGVHLILSAVPHTPVVACWIEDGWGSFSSFQGGPPATGKKMDILKRIRIGFAAPEVLPAEILADDRATRRHLMQAVLGARAHIGLPPHPMPPFGGEGKTDPPGDASEEITPA